MKRLFDIIVAAAGIVILSPVMLIVAALVRFMCGGPVLFRQTRTGRHMKTFEILKFRTMVEDAPEIGPGVTVGDDWRVTRLGHLLRKTKLDELPQLINVLRGDMSFVGPRPELPKYVARYPDDFREILKTRPGITDLASIVYRDESALLGRAQDPETYYVEVVLPDKLRMARDYVRHTSLLYDLRLICTTLVVLLYPHRRAESVIAWLGRWRAPLSFLGHTLVAVAANAGAFLIRFEGRVPVLEWQRFLVALPVIVLLRLVAFQFFGVFRTLWRYFGTRDLERIGFAVAASSAAFLVVLPALPGGAGYSRGAVFIDALLCAALLVGLRLTRRAQSMLGGEVPRRRRALLVATGDVADRVLRGLSSDPMTPCLVIGVLEDHASRAGATLHNVPVLGSRAHLEDVLARERPEEILVAGHVPEVVRGIVKSAARFETPVRAIPDPSAAVSGVAAEASFAPADLLFREPIESDPAVIRAFYEGRTILITGAGGSIGSEICRQVASLRPARLVLFEKHEASLFFIERELRAQAPELDLVAVIGDITDVDRVGLTMRSTRPDVVFHAAAYKHVPMMESHPSEAYRTNVVGTRVVAEAAARAGAGIFVLISTDKAVEPVSTMGLTKRIAELTVLGMNGSGAPRFMAVRFGNVLDSSGSVVPLFREQIEKGGPITVTHADVTRLFMTVPEAVQLILHAGTMGRGGEVFVLDMGKPVRILDLAKALARLHGLLPGRDIDIVFTGLRPGERLFETLFNDHERIWKTDHPKILMAANGGATVTDGEGRAELRRLLQVLEERMRTVVLVDGAGDPARATNGAGGPNGARPAHEGNGAHHGDGAIAPELPRTVDGPPAGPVPGPAPAPGHASEAARP